jgi:hypothetical protein
MLRLLKRNQPALFPLIPQKIKELKSPSLLPRHAKQPYVTRYAILQFFRNVTRRRLFSISRKKQN